MVFEKFKGWIDFLWNKNCRTSNHHPRQSSPSTTNRTKKKKKKKKKKKINRNMERLVTRLVENDPELKVLGLTSECEAHELPMVLHALEINNTVRHVIFRESFFPLHRIRQHLSPTDFNIFVQAVGALAHDSLEINPSMKGMVRGQTIARILSSSSSSSSSKEEEESVNEEDNEEDNDDDDDEVDKDQSTGLSLRHLVAHSSLSLVDRRDVEFLSDSLHNCNALEQVTLTDCFLTRFRNNPIFLNPLMETFATCSQLQRLELSCHPSSFMSSSRQDNSKLYSCCFNPEVLDLLLSSIHHSLEWLSLCQLGLHDEHFQTIANHLVRGGDSTMTSNNDKNNNCKLPLKHLVLNGNDPTQFGIDMLLQALQDNPHQSMEHLELKMTQQVTPSPLTLRTMLTSNLTLTQLLISHLDEDTQRDVDFFLKLNRLGRKSILTSCEAGNTLNSPLLEEILSDPSVLYYFLKSMPGILVAL